MLPPPPRSTLFPYTTLFRSVPAAGESGERTLLAQHERAAVVAVPGPEADTDLHRRAGRLIARELLDRKSTRLNSSHQIISYAVFCLKKKKHKTKNKKRQHKY